MVRPFCLEAFLIERARGVAESYPRPFWILAGGLLVNSIGGSMVWPFLTIYMRQSLVVPLTVVTLLFTLNSAAGLLATSAVGPAVDRFGRKRAILTGLLLMSMVQMGMSAAAGLAAWALLMALQGMAGPIYRVGADAMVADLVPSERRTGAYAVLRMGNNLGIAIGPAIGGFVTAVSYSLAFYFAAASNLLFALLVLLGLRETLRPAEEPAGGPAGGPVRSGGYGPVLADHHFVAFCITMILATVPAAMLMMLLPVYANENFGVPETQYGFIMATNAVMVVLFQFPVTRISTRYSQPRMLTLGALLYAVGVGSVALGQGFLGFWLSMVILTCGELLLVPTGTALAANMAPAEMRGRYMGLYGLGWGVAFGIGPVIGGLLNDNVSPQATWLAGALFGLAAAAGFTLLAARLPGRARSSPDLPSAS
jgi:MFS family permease